MAFDATDFQVTTLPDPLSLTTPRARLEYMRDFLRTLPRERFDMGDPGTLGDAKIGWCQSPSCIGGWLVARFQFGSHDIRDAGVSLLGLGRDVTEDLFFPCSARVSMGDGVSPYCAAPADAVQVLSHLIATGEVDWSVARKAEG